MEGSGRILTLFCAEKHQKLVTPQSRRRQGPLSAGWESCGGSGLGGGLPGRAWCEGRGPRPQGRAESRKPAPAPLPQLELPSRPLRPEQLAQASVTSSRKSHFSCGRSQNSSTNGLGLGHAAGSPEPSPEEHKTSAPLSSRVREVSLPPRRPSSRACGGGLVPEATGSPSAWTALARRLRPPSAGNAFPFSVTPRKQSHPQEPRRPRTRRLHPFSYLVILRRMGRQRRRGRDRAARSPWAPRGPVLPGLHRCPLRRLVPVWTRPRCLRWSLQTDSRTPSLARGFRRESRTADPRPLRLRTGVNRAELCAALQM